MSEEDRVSEGLHRLFHARSVAVVGASANPNKLGHIILSNILEGGFEGDLYPVNPRGGEILGLTAYSSVSDVPGKLDLVVVVVPAPYVAGVLREASHRGVRASVVISGGFREVGRDDLEAELVSIARESGLRIIGPNCQGINYRPNKLCASWPLVDATGPLAVISQSGTVAATVAGWAADEGLGITATVALGNQVDVCEADMIEFFSRDRNTRAMALYLEGARDGRRLMRTLKDVGARKPLVILKSGRTSAGQRAAASHTRSLAGRDEVFSGACRQCGVVRAPDLESLYDSAKALGTLVPLRGNRLLIVTSSGGAGILAVDESERSGLSVPPLPRSLVEELQGRDLPPTAVLANPLDLTMSTAADFDAALSVIARHDIADVYLLVFGDPIPGATHVARRLRDVVGRCVAVAYLGGAEVEKAERVSLHTEGIPVFPTPEQAVRAIGAAAWVGRFRSAAALAGETR